MVLPINRKRTLIGERQGNRDEPGTRLSLDLHLEIAPDHQSTTVQLCMGDLHVQPQPIAAFRSPSNGLGL